MIEKIHHHETDIETLMREALERRGYIKNKDFSQQRSTRTGFILDFAFDEKRLAIECDGEHVHGTQKGKKRDRFRDRKNRHNGWTTIRFTGTEIHTDVEKCVDKIEEELKKLGNYNYYN